MRLLGELLLALLVLILAACSPRATTANVVGTWVVPGTGPDIRVTVSFLANLTFVQIVEEKSLPPKTVTGKWVLDGHKVRMTKMLWRINEKWIAAPDYYYYWELRPSRRTPGRLAIFGGLDSDPDRYVELEKSP